MEEELFSFLSTTLSHSRVYPVILPQKPTLPAVAYTRVGSPDELTSSGRADLVQGRFQIDVYADDYAQAKTTARSIRTALSGYRGTMGSVRVDSAWRDRQDESYEPETRRYRVSTDYIINFEE